jgi:hypothetical protein
MRSLALISFRRHSYMRVCSAAVIFSRLMGIGMKERIPRMSIGSGFVLT